MLKDARQRAWLIAPHIVFGDGQGIAGRSWLQLVGGLISLVGAVNLE